MTNDTTDKDGADVGPETATITADSPGAGDSPNTGDSPEKGGSPDDRAELPGEPDEVDNDDSGEDVASGAGAISGGLGFAGLALAIVSLTTNWTSGVVVSHGQYSQQMNAGSSGMPTQQQLNMFESGWHTQGWWAFVFAAVAVLFGVGALLWPKIWPGGTAPGWAKAGATSAIIVGLVGVILAVLTVVGVFGGHLTAPTTAG